ncbi:MAG: glycosyl hydrolase family 38 [Mangrovibacterium sp.]
MKRILLYLCLVIIPHSFAEAYPVKKGVLIQGYAKALSGRSGSISEMHAPGLGGQTLQLNATGKPVTIEWESGEVPGQSKGNTIIFALDAAISKYNPATAPMSVNLYADNRKLMTFDIPLEEDWAFTNKDVTVSFEEYFETRREHILGYLYISMPSKMVVEGKPVIFRMETTSSGNDQWLMIVKKPVENSLSALCTPFILKNSGKQVVRLKYSHFGAPANAVIRCGDVTETCSLNFGINYIEVGIPSVTNEKDETVTVKVGKNTLSSNVKLRPAKEWKINFVQHTHTDLGYTRPPHEILAEHIRFIDCALDYCDQTEDYPDDAKFRWTCESAWIVSEYMRTRPKGQIERLKKRINEGRIEVTGMYFNFDELPGEQDLAYSLYPLKELNDNQIEIKTAMQNDVNGIAWCFSEFLPDMGIKYIIMGINKTRSLLPFDNPTAFWWESPSGKKILTFRGEHYNMGNNLHVEQGDFETFEMLMGDYLLSLENNGYPYDIASAQYSGYLTDNSPPSTAGSDMVRQWNEKYSFPKVRQAVASEFMEDMENRYGNQLQTIRGAWPDWWNDGYASAARESAVARYSQAGIISNQIGLSLSKILGADIPPTVFNDIDEAYNALLLYDEHTFGYHASVSEPFHKETMEQRSQKGSYAWEAWRRTFPIKETVTGLLQPYLPRKKEFANITVFNPFNWEHSGQVTVYADREIIPYNKQVILKDSQGTETPMQMIRSYSDASYWTFWVDNLPPLGMKNYTVHVSPGTPSPIKQNNEKVQVIENNWYRIVLDPEKGVVSEWYDKELKKNLLANDTEWKMGELVYERNDTRTNISRLKPGNYTRFSPENVMYEGLTEGPVWDAYRFRGTSPAGMDKDNFFMELRIYKNRKLVSFTYRLKKKLETGPEALYVVFPFELLGGKIFFDVPGGVIEAGVDQIPGSSNDWNTVQNFTTVRSDSGQIVLCSPEIFLMQFGNINLGRFRSGAVPETNHIYTWPMNNYWYTNFNADQHGEFEWNYFLTSTPDTSLQVATQFAWGNRVPLQATVLPAGVSNNNKTICESILKTNQPNILLVNMTPVKGENSLLLQMREIGGKYTPLTITSPYLGSLTVQECSPVGEVLSDKKVSFKPWENKFIKISW